MKYTLLELTQQILSALDGDEVTDITETTEAKQVVKVLKNTYWDIVTRLDVPEHYSFFQLTESSSATPTLMTLPSSGLNIVNIKYNAQLDTDTEVDFQDVDWLELKEFMDRMYMLSGDETTVDQYSYTINSQTFNILALNDRAPKFYTTFDDSTLLFDAYNSSEETYLEAAKTMVYGYYLPTWTESNSFTPDLDAKQFALLLNEAKAQAFIELKQVANSKAEQRARGGWIQSQKTKRAIPYPRPELERLPNYGRK